MPTARFSAGFRPLFGGKKVLPRLVGTYCADLRVLGQATIWINLRTRRVGCAYRSIRRAAGYAFPDGSAGAGNSDGPRLAPRAVMQSPTFYLEVGLTDAEQDPCCHAQGHEGENCCPSSREPAGSSHVRGLGSSGNEASRVPSRWLRWSKYAGAVLIVGLLSGLGARGADALTDGATDVVKSISR